MSRVAIITSSAFFKEIFSQGFVKLLSFGNIYSIIFFVMGIGFDQTYTLHMVLKQCQHEFKQTSTQKKKQGIVQVILGS
jgi:hypothetical protein